MWIDAVCINQRDISERNAQVANMTSIFACAENVIVWLGEGDENDAAHGFLTCLYYHWKGDNVHDPSVIGSTPTSCTLIPRNYPGTWFYKPSLEEIITTRPRIAKAVEVIVGKRFFSRRWIVQEIHWAQSAEIRWGRHHISLPRLVAILERLFRMFGGLKDKPWKDDREQARITLLHFHEMVGNALRVCLLRRMVRHSTSVRRLSLVEVLGQCRGLRCSDPRDVVYAVLSLVKGPRLVVDYGLSTFEVYLALSRLLLEQDCLGMMFTETIIRICGSESHRTLLSWMPDWNNLSTLCAAKVAMADAQIHEKVHLSAVYAA